jgi:HEAT repeat protein
MTEKPGPAQSLDEALLAVLGEGGAIQRLGADGDGGSGDPRDPRLPSSGSDENARRNSILDALARGGSRNISTLIAALRSADDDVAMYAATALGEARDPAAVPHLIRLLQHPDLNVAQAAIDALGKLRALSAAAPIEAMLEADPWLRFAAAHAIGEIAHPGSVHALMRAAADPAISELAIEALGKIATVSSAVVLTDLLVDRGSVQSFDACLLALGTCLRGMPDWAGLETTRAWQRLLSFTASGIHRRLVDILVAPDVELDGAIDRHFLKEAAIAVVRILGLPELLSALVKAAWDVAIGEPLLDAVLFAGDAMRPYVLAGLVHVDADVRVFCATATATLGLAEGTEACAALLGAPEPRVRVSALRALASLAAERFMPAMIECFADPVETVRAAAVRALGAMDGTLATSALLADGDFAHAHAALVLQIMRSVPYAAQSPFVREALSDRREEVRRAAVGVLAANDQTDVMDELATLLDDPSVAVRSEVVQALARRRSHKAAGLLFARIERDEEIREAILRALGRAGDSWTARQLMEVYGQHELSVRLLILDALGAITAPIAEPFLAQRLCDALPDVRSRAVVAIGQYAGEGAVTRLVHATRDTDARVRLAALESLSSFAGRPAAVEAFERLCLDPVPAIAALARRCLRKG